MTRSTWNKGIYVIPAEQRFLCKIKKLDNGCWEWTAHKVKRYGVFWFEGKAIMAHRFSYEHFVSSIPNELTIDHLCRNTFCVNPSHLEPVPLRENVLRGENLAAKNLRKTLCHKGHPLIPNPRSKKGHRWCPVCHKELMKNWSSSHKDQFNQYRKQWRASRKEAGLPAS